MRLSSSACSHGNQLSMRCVPSGMMKMYNKSNLQRVALSGRCRCTHHRKDERWFHEEKTSLSRNERNLRKLRHRNISSQQSIRILSTLPSFPRITIGSNGTVTTPFESSLPRPFSSVSNTEARITPSWNDRVRDFLGKSPTNHGDAAEVQTLFADLLEITAASRIGTNSLVSQYDDLGEYENNYLGWRTIDFSLSPYSPIYHSNNDELPLENAIATTDIATETIDVRLAFGLIDRLVSIETDDDAGPTTYAIQWSTHRNCLNPVLQLWKEEYSPSSSKKTKSKQLSDSGSLTPSEVLSKLDFYRRHSNTVVPDVQSYNIIMDAVATHDGSSHTDLHGRARRKYAVDVAFCQSLWEWMWKESNLDSVVRPDGITLRTMLKAHVMTGHKLAPHRCESLIDEWIEYQKNQQILRDTDEESSSDEDQPFLHDPKGTLLQSLIHVWALHNPQIAESYLNELASRYLSGESALPPDTIAWNRVVSAYSIVHGQPRQGLAVLESFWKFYRKAHGLESTSSSPSLTTMQNANNTTGDSAGVNTKTNSLKLRNATAISQARDRFGLSEPVSSAIDNAIWKVHPPNLETYNALLEGFARQSNAQEADKIFDRMQNASSISPDIATYTSIIKANGSDLEKVKDLALQCLNAYETEEEVSGEVVEGGREAVTSKRLQLDLAFFHAWLRACAESQNVKEAKSVLKTMKGMSFTPNATTYRMLINVFLSERDSQGAIEWLLAYAKLENMSESAIVSCTTTLLDWYRKNQSENKSGDVDAMVLLQILCENDFITQDEPLQQLLLGVSSHQATAVIEWLRTKKDRTNLKHWAIAMRSLAQDSTEPSDVEKFFSKLRETSLWQNTSNLSSTDGMGRNDEDLIIEMYSSIIIAWCKHQRMDEQSKQRIQYWTRELESREGSPSPNHPAQMHLLTSYCERGDLRRAEQYIEQLRLSYEKGKIAAPPDTIMHNMVLNVWAQKANGKRASSFFEKQIQSPDVVSYNTVINAFARQGKIDEAEDWALKLVASFVDTSIESLRPQQATFTVILAAWRRSRHPRAAERAEKILSLMHQLYEKDVLLSGPNVKSYQTVLDTWGKSRNIEAAKRAEELVFSSPDFKDNKRLRKKIKDIKSRVRKLKRLRSNAGNDDGAE